MIYIAFGTQQDEKSARVCIEESVVIRCRNEQSSRWKSQTEVVCL